MSKVATKKTLSTEEQADALLSQLREPANQEPNQEFPEGNPKEEIKETSHEELIEAAWQANLNRIPGMQAETAKAEKARIEKLIKEGKPAEANEKGYYIALAGKERAANKAMARRKLIKGLYNIKDYIFEYSLIEGMTERQTAALKEIVLVLENTESALVEKATPAPRVQTAAVYDTMATVEKIKVQIKVLSDLNDGTGTLNKQIAILTEKLIALQTQQ